MSRPGAKPARANAPESGREAGAARPLTVAIRVGPASSRTAVGGRRGDALVVRVTQPAVDGRATEAALVALARALGVRRSALRLRSGATSRDKVVAIDRVRPGLEGKIAALLRNGDDS